MTRSISIEAIENAKNVVGLKVGPELYMPPANESQSQLNLEKYLNHYGIIIKNL